MDVNEKFVNRYIEKLTKRAEDAAKTELMALTHLELLTEANAELNKRIEQLEAEKQQLVSQLRMAMNTLPGSSPGNVEKKLKQHIKETT